MAAVATILLQTRRLNLQLSDEGSVRCCDANYQDRVTGHGKSLFLLELSAASNINIGIGSEAAQ